MSPISAFYNHNCFYAWRGDPFFAIMHGVLEIGVNVKEAQFPVLFFAPHFWRPLPLFVDTKSLENAYTVV